MIHINIDELKSIAANIRIFKKNEVILEQEEKVDFVYFMLEGSCYRSYITDKGSSIIYEVKVANDTVGSFLGVLSLYTPDQKNLYRFTAKEECNCLVIPLDSFISWTESTPDLAIELLKMAMEQYRNLQKSFQAYQEGRNANRLCMALIQKSGIKDGKHILDKKNTLVEMASSLGIHAVTVSRIMRVLCEQGILTRTSQGYVIEDINELYQYACNQKKLKYK